MARSRCSTGKLQIDKRPSWTMGSRSWKFCFRTCEEMTPFMQAREILSILRSKTGSMMLEIDVLFCKHSRKLHAWVSGIVPSFVADVVRQTNSSGTGGAHIVYLVSDLPLQQLPDVVIVEPDAAIGCRSRQICRLYLQFVNVQPSISLSVKCRRDVFRRRLLFFVAIDKSRRAI